MSNNVSRTKENLDKCLCMTCPSYIFFCKMKSMPANVLLMMSMEKKIYAEAMFCAYGSSSQCVGEEKGCVCSNCEVFKENKLGKGYFCTTKDGK